MPSESRPGVRMPSRSPVYLMSMGGNSAPRCGRPLCPCRRLPSVPTDHVAGSHDWLWARWDGDDGVRRSGAVRRDVTASFGRPPWGSPEVSFGRRAAGVVLLVSGALLLIGAAAARIPALLLPPLGVL